MTDAATPAQTDTDDVLLTLTSAVEEFWPSDKPGAVLLAPETAAEIINFLHANGYQIEAIEAREERLDERMRWFGRAESITRALERLLADEYDSPDERCSECGAVYIIRHQHDDACTGTDCLAATAGSVEALDVEAHCRWCRAQLDMNASGDWVGMDPQRIAQWAKVEQARQRLAILPIADGTTPHPDQGGQLGPCQAALLAGRADGVGDALLALDVGHRQLEGKRERAPRPAELTDR